MKLLTTLALSFAIVASVEATSIGRKMHRSHKDLTYGERLMFLDKVDKLQNRLQISMPVDLSKTPLVRQESPVNETEGNDPTMGSPDFFSNILKISEFSFDQAQEMVQFFFYQLLNDVFLYNIEDCTFWIFDTITDFMNGILLMIEENDPLTSLLSFSYSFHKAPVSYYSCSRVGSDYAVINDFFISIQKDPALWDSYAITVFWNLVFNAADILFEYQEL
mmetsp:Transcript_11311/g.19045  ORF Transcript_11311/g.19045 Transcript_11311/m.19045 type:complete len:220 (+) Transcript_11311:3-662(+)